MANDLPKITLHHNRTKFGTYSWQGQAPQYDQLGDPGEIVCRRFDNDGWPVDTLLYYGTDAPYRGYLVGVLNHYPQGGPRNDDGKPLEDPGNVNMFVCPDPGLDDQVITRTLLAEAKRRWKVTDETPLKLAIGTDTAHTTAGVFTDGTRRIARIDRI